VAAIRTALRRSFVFSFSISDCCLRPAFPAVFPAAVTHVCNGTRCPWHRSTPLPPALMPVSFLGLGHALPVLRPERPHCPRRCSPRHSRTRHSCTRHSRHSCTRRWCTRRCCIRRCCIRHWRTPRCSLHPVTTAAATGAATVAATPPSATAPLATVAAAAAPTAPLAAVPLAIVLRCRAQGILGNFARGRAPPTN